MEDFEKISNEFYESKYELQREDDSKEIWKRIKSNKELLNWAIKKRKGKFGNDLVNSLAICDTILVDYDGIDNNIYQELVDLIYTNRDIARIVSSNDYKVASFSYLLLTLWNSNLKLTDEQKAFAVSEAMSETGTVKYGNYMDKQPKVHGYGNYDIRYWILRRPDWSLEEKQKLIMDFWSSDEEYDETLEQWEWAVVNDHANYKNRILSSLDRYEMFHLSYEQLLKLYSDKETTDRIWDEMEFCKQMHKLRPQQWELETAIQKTI